MPSIAVKRLSSVSGNQKQVSPKKDRQSEFIRIRELELDPNLYDTTTGEYFKPSPKPARQQKQATDAWVSAKLNNRRLA